MLHDKQTMLQAVMREYPKLDYLMAETLVKLYEQGGLEEYDLETQRTPSHTSQGGGITVENISPEVKACEAPKAA
jgi:hypothetical protein